MSRGAIAIGAVLALGVVGVVAVQQEDAPDVDHALVQAVLPAIDETLQRGPWRVDAGRWFCAEHVIETTRRSNDLAVWLHAVCMAYDSDGSALVSVGGESVLKRVTLTPEAPHQVTRVEEPPDGAGNSEWIRRNASAATVRAWHGRNATGLGEQNASEARQAFGLPPDAPIRQR